MKSSMASAFISNFTKKGDYVYDPFCGCSTVAFEAWAAHRNVIAVDLNPYAYILSHAKLFPCMSQEKAVWEINKYSKLIDSYISEVDLRNPDIKNSLYFGGMARKRFISLTMQNKALIEDLAKSYARLFNLGLSTTKPDLETYYTKGKTESFGFSDLKKIKKAKMPTKQEIKNNVGGTLFEDFKRFYESIVIEDNQARAFFVSEFKKELSSDLRQLFNKAISGSFKIRSTTF